MTLASTRKGANGMEWIWWTMDNDLNWNGIKGLDGV